MQKKRILGIPVTLFVIGLMVIGGSIATIMENFGSYETEVTVESPIEVSGPTTTTVTGTAGEEIESKIATITSSTNNELDLQITTTEEEGLETYYKSILELVEKDVDFEADKWNIIDGGETATVEYVLGGKSFDAEVTENAKEGYELIYYKDNTDRFDNPAEVIKIADIGSTNLPYDNDKNKAEIDYCVTGEYDTCHGAKIWYVPSDAINSDDTLDWSRADEFLFESKLIQYNSDSQVTIYPNSEFSFNTVIVPDVMYNGITTLTTSVDIVE